MARDGTKKNFARLGRKVRGRNWLTGSTNPCSEGEEGEDGGEDEGWSVVNGWVAWFGERGEEGSVDSGYGSWGSGTPPTGRFDWGAVRAELERREDEGGGVGRSAGANGGSAESGRSELEGEGARIVGGEMGGVGLSAATAVVSAENDGPGDVASVYSEETIILTELPLGHPARAATSG